MFRIVSWLLILGAIPFSVPVLAIERNTEHTVSLSPGEKSPPATLADMRWLEGHWVGDAFGGVGEETWMAPSGGSMLGMYRIVRDGKPVFFEIMMLVERQGSLTLTLKHFNADLTGWEEKDKVVEFPLVAVEKNAIHFAGMSFHPSGDTLTVYLAIEQKEGTIREEKFVYRRKKPD
jgi:hypothetical protein